MRARASTSALAAACDGARASAATKSTILSLAKPKTAIGAPVENGRSAPTSDANGDADMDISDATATLNCLFLGGPRPPCEKSADVNLTMGFKFNDTNERYALEVRRGVVQFHAEIPDNTSISMVTDRDYLNRMLVGDIPITGEMVAAIEGGDPAPMVAIMAAIDSGVIKVEGDTKKDVQKFFSFFARPFDLGSIKLIVR